MVRSTLVHFEVRDVKNYVLGNFKESVIFDTKMPKAKNCASEGGKSERYNVPFNIKDKI